MPPFVKRDFETGEIEHTFDTMEDLLKKIANAFMELRYGYEKYVECGSNVFYDKFVLDFNDALHEQCKKLIYDRDII